MDGLAVAMATRLARAPVMFRFEADARCLGCVCGTRRIWPSTQSHSAVSTVSRSEDPKVPLALIMAQSATAPATDAPRTGANASAHGAEDFAKAAAGSMPISAAQ